MLIACSDESSSKPSGRKDTHPRMYQYQKRDKPVENVAEIYSFDLQSKLETAQVYNTNF